MRATTSRSEAFPDDPAGTMASDAVWRLRLLADAGEALASSLDYETTLRTVARLAIPRLADWCIVYIVNDDGSIRRLAIEGPEPGSSVASDVQARFRIDPQASGGVARVIATGDPVFLPDAGPADLAADVDDPDAMVRILTPLGIKSWICVPLVARGRTLGAISLVSVAEGRRYDQIDLSLALELATRSALAMENALLYHRAQRSLAEADRTVSLLDSFFAGTPVGMAFVDRNLRVIKVNRAHAAMMARAPDSLEGASATDLVRPPLAGRVLESLRTVLETGSPLTDVEVDDSSAGAGLHLIANYHPVRDSEGSVVGVGATFWDVTDRKRSERELEENRRRLQALFDNALDAIALLDQSGRFVDVNPATCELLGLDRSALIGRDMWSLGAIDEEATRALWDSFTVEGRIGGDISIRRPDGDQRIVEFRAVADFLPGLHLAVVRDVTQRRRAEAERDRLLESERRARHAAERSRDLIARIQEVTARLSRAVTQEEAARVVLEAVSKTMGAGSGAVALRQGDALTVVASTGYDAETLEAWRRFPIEAQVPAAHTARTGEMVLLGSFEDRDERFPALMLERKSPAMATVPLTGDERPAGVLVVSFDQPRTFAQEERLFLLAAGEQCGQAVARSRLYEAERAARADAERTGELLTRLQRVTAALAATRTMAEVAEVVLGIGRQALGASKVAVATADGDALCVVSWVGYDDELMRRWGRFAIADNLPMSEAFRTRDLVVVEDPSERNRRFPLLAKDPVPSGAVVCVPMMSEGAAIGGLSFGFHGLRHFDDDERLFLLSLGEQCGQAIARARLQEAERRARAEAETRREHLHYLAEASRILASSLDYDETLERVARLIVPGLADWCSVMLLDDDERLRPVALAHRDPERASWVEEMQRRYPPRPDARVGAVNVIRTGEPELYPEVTDETLRLVAHDDEHFQALKRLGFVSGMAVPLVRHGKPVGAITLISAESGRRYGRDELAFAMDVAQRASQAIENAWLFREVREQRQRLRFKRALLESQKEAAIEGQLVVGLEGEILSHNRRFLEMWGIPEDTIAEGRDASALDVAIQKLRDPHVFLDRVRYLYEHPFEHSRDQLELTDGRVFDRWSAPLITEEGTLLGRAWYFRDVTDQKRAERTLADSKRRADFLAEASAVLSSSLDYREFLARAADLAAARFSDWCAVELVRSDGQVERIALAHRDPVKRELVRRFGAERRIDRFEAHAPAGSHKVIRTGRWELSHDVPDACLIREAGGEQAYLDRLRTFGLSAFVSVPMIARGRVLGAMTFFLEGGARAYDPSDLAVAHDLAYRAASALDNARLYEERSYVARTLQASLLPPTLPAIPGAEVAAAYRAAGEAYAVGGDFYDLFETGGDDWVVVVGDVCGKGPDAAATTALARHTLRAAAMQARKPSRVLGMLNEAMLRADARFCTVSYLRVRPNEQGLHITVACGGHPLPLVLRRDGRVEPAGHPGTLLGSFREPVLRDVTVDLASGDAIVLYTDGVIEARSGGEAFGEQRLEALLAGCTRYDPATIAETIEGAAVTFSDGEPRDDIAVVVLKAR